MIHDDHLAAHLENELPRPLTTAQVNARVDTAIDELLRLRANVRTLATTVGFLLALVLGQFGYALWGHR
jgi:hypothetical protein